MDDYRTWILPPDEHYCVPKQNEIRFIGNRQTIALVMGSCISTVFVAGRGPYFAAANHIVIANPAEGSIIATKGARMQIEQIIEVFEREYGVGSGDIRCLHLIGAGSGKDRFRIAEENVREVVSILDEKRDRPVFRDTGSYMHATYSINGPGLSVLVENLMLKEHLSFSIDLDRLMSERVKDSSLLPAAPLVPNDPGFEFLVAKRVITFIPGTRKRQADQPDDAS